MRIALCGVLLVWMVFGAASAQAGTVFTDLPGFQAQLKPGYYLENFDGIALGVITSPKSFSSGGYSYAASATMGLYGEYAPGSGTDKVLSTNDAHDPLVFTFTSGNVTAVGGYFFPTGASGELLSGSTTLSLSDGTVYTLVNGTPSTFVGFTTASGVWITSLTVDALETPDFRWPTVNDLYVGQSDAVPEPATGALLVGGALLLAALSRRRKA